MYKPLLKKESFFGIFMFHRPFVRHRGRRLYQAVTLAELKFLVHMDHLEGASNLNFLPLAKYLKMRDTKLLFLANGIAAISLKPGPITGDSTNRVD